jgi:ADP-L-glycero-D-manno-heptose 6-epimerase
MAMVLVTGAAGFIGSNVARAFSRDGRDVVACDRLRTGGKWRNLLGVPLHDLVTPEALPGWLAANVGNVDLVLHFGAVSATTESDVDRIVRDNIRLSLDLWVWCAQNNVAFIYASSAATYGDGSHGFADDQDPAALGRLRPLNAYGWSKQVVDWRFIADVTSIRAHPPQWVGLKFFNVYGPGEDHKGEMRSVINKIIPIVRDGGAVRLFRSYRDDYADGAQMRDFVYVDDIVSIVQWLTRNQQVSGIFNVGSGQARTWNDMARIVSACLGRDPLIEYVDMPEAIRSQYQYFTQAPIEKLRSAGWTESTTSLEQGVSAYIAAAA